MESEKNLFSYRQFWAKRFGTATVLPMSQAEMDELGWDSCDYYSSLPVMPMLIIPASVWH